MVFMPWDSQQPSCTGECEILYFQRPRPPPRSVLMAQLEFIGSAQAQSYANAKLVDKGFHKFKIGDVEVAQIYDGI